MPREQMLLLRNDVLSVGLAPDFGGEIREIRRGRDVNLLFYEPWRSPVPAGRNLSYGNPDRDWLSAYRGGWQTLFPNSGMACNVMNTTLPLHGEVSRAQWCWSWIDRDRKLRMCSTTRLPLVIERTISLDAGAPVLRIADTIINESAYPVPFLYGHHPAYGPPLTAPGARIDLPGGAIVNVDRGHQGSHCDLLPGACVPWPEVPDRNGGRCDLSMVPDAIVDRLCYIEPREAWYAIRHPSAGLGVAMTWDLGMCPVLWFWQDTGSRRFPLHGRSKITALEPQSQKPAHGLANAIAAGQQHELAARSRRSTELTFCFFEADTRPVRAVRPSGEIVRG